MKTFKLLSIIFSLFFIFSCSNKPNGSDYLGKWTNGNKVMIISRVGESFLVVGHVDGVYTISKEKNLIRSGPGNTISYDKETNTLIFSRSLGGGIDRWTRLQDEDGDQTNKNELAGKTERSNNSIKDTVIIGKRFYPKSSVHVYMQTEPHGEGQRVLNIKATDYFGTNEYYRVSNLDQIIILEEQGEWVKVRHVRFPENTGWLQKKDIEFGEKKIEAIYPLSENEYSLEKVTSTATKNFYILAKVELSSKNQASLFVKRLRAHEKFKAGNIYVFDDIEALNLFDKNPLVDKDYIYVAEHFIAMSTFDSTDNIWWFPYIDADYRNYGGKKSKE